jgi:hypothetical protein
VELGEIRQRQDSPYRKFFHRENTPIRGSTKRRGTLISKSHAPHPRYKTYTVDTSGRTTPRPVPERPHGSDRREGDSHEDGLPLGSGRDRHSIQPRAMGSRLSPTTRATRDLRRKCNQTENHNSTILPLIPETRDLRRFLVSGMQWRRFLVSGMQW